MPHKRPNILILGGDLKRASHRRPILRWLDRLESRQLALQLLCYAAPGPPDEHTRILAIPSLASPWVRWLAIHWLQSDQRLNRPDLIHVIDESMTELAITLVESLRIPYVQTVNGYRTLDRGLRISRRWCRRITATTPDLASDLVALLGVPPALLTVVPPGVVCPELPERANSPRSIPVIGTGGTVDSAAGFAVFLEAARLFLDSGRDAEFILSAHGNEPVELRRLAQDLRLGERLTVVDDASDGTDFWSVLDIYCQPSLSATAGLRLLLASARALPLIATHVKGPREMIDPGVNGLLVPPGDARGIARAIVQLLDQPAKAIELGKAARRFVQTHYDPEVEADRLADVYYSALK